MDSFCLSRDDVFSQEYPRIFGDVKSSGSFLFYKAAEFCVAVEDIVVLVAMTGENIGNQRFRFGNKETLEK